MVDYGVLIYTSKSMDHEKYTMAMIIIKYLYPNGEYMWIKKPKMKFIHGILLYIPYIYPMISIIYLNIHGIKISHGRWRPPTPAPPWGEEMSIWSVFEIQL